MGLNQVPVRRQTRDRLILQDFLEAIATEHGVSDTEFRVLSHALGGESAEAIAKKLGTEPQVIRNRLREVYKKFQIRGMGPAKLAKLQQHLISEYQAHSSQSRSLASIAQVAMTSFSWSEAPELGDFYGRAEELATLEQWIVKDRCRLVAILGMGGIGKTTLSRELAEQIQDDFEYIIWRSLRNEPSVQNLLADLIEVLSNKQETDLPEDIEPRISCLIEYLEKYRCLLVLDDVETILESGYRFGWYQQKHKGYGILLRRVGEVPHQSCLLLNSQEKPQKITILESPKRLVRSYHLKGLKPEDAQKILEEKGLTGEEQWENLIRFAGGHPLALKIVATTIQDLFNGNVAEFVKHQTWVFGDLSEILEEQFKRLSNLEQQILRYLVSEPNSVSLPKFKENLPDSLRTSEIMEALASLLRRTWIETVNRQEKNYRETLYTIPYLLKKYVNRYQTNME